MSALAVILALPCLRPAIAEAGETGTTLMTDRRDILDSGDGPAPRRAPTPTVERQRRWRQVGTGATGALAAGIVSAWTAHLVTGRLDMPGPSRFDVFVAAGYAGMGLGATLGVGLAGRAYQEGTTATWVGTALGAVIGAVTGALLFHAMFFTSFELCALGLPGCFFGGLVLFVLLPFVVAGSIALTAILGLAGYELSQDGPRFTLMPGPARFGRTGSGWYAVQPILGLRF